MKRLYLAGPMRGYPLCNFPLFNAVAEAWRGDGWEVMNPAEEDVKQDGIDPNNPDNFKPFAHYMRRDIEILLTVDAIAFLPAWEKSEGARIEHTVAKALDLEMYDAISGKRIVTT